MDIPHQELHRIWVRALAGLPGAETELEALHAKHPELVERFERFKTTLDRIRSGKTKKRKKPTRKANPTNWTKAQDSFLSSTTGSVKLVQGGATGLKR
ncbi:hypothetical protein [Comamonas squillarum]|uniref:Uncharacterized protein n=1 Tax=Comamonas squillarum TaxID=2977320 RepID=A0ABY5ZZK3_9BURK|nr:hypothetical protein [Comamonas sp. PR12]UXC19129.1 hypothetical protein N4T19_03110 [Comamonas sp. PR12]